MSETSSGLSNIAYFRTDGGSSKLYTQEYVNEKDKEIDRLNNIINELENIRKEAIKYVQEKADYPISYYRCLNDLLNILNKGDNKE